MNWSDAPPDWNTPIGEKIDRFLQAVAERFPGYSETIVVFGSATIHLRLDPAFNSANADIRVGTDDILPFKALTEELGMGKSGQEGGISISTSRRPVPSAQRTSGMDERTVKHATG